MRYPVTVEIRGSNPLRGAKFPERVVEQRKTVHCKIGKNVTVRIKQGLQFTRGSYSGNTLAFQAKARSSILLPRSTQVDI